MANSGFVNGAMKCVGSGEAVSASGDAWSQVTLGTTRAYSWGLDDSDSDSLKINTDADATVDPSSGTNIWKMSVDGERTMPLQPSFQSYLNSSVVNATGDGTVYTIVYDTEVFDQGSDFNNATGVFTAPVAGRYMFSCVVSLAALGAAHTSGNLNIVTTGRTYVVNLSSYGAMRSVANGLVIGGTVIANMAAGDTATVTITVENSTKTVGVNGSGLSHFSGVLLC